MNILGYDSVENYKTLKGQGNPAQYEKPRVLFGFLYIIWSLFQVSF